MTYMMFKEGIDVMETEPNVVEKFITHSKENNIFDAMNKTDKPQAYQSKKIKYSSNKSNKGISLDKLI